MALQDDVRDLGAISTLRDLGPDALRLIAFSSETRILRAGDVLFRRGEASDGGCGVLAGAVTLDAGRGRTTIVRGPALLGDAALLVDTARPATASAREPSSVLRISRALFRRVLGEYPSGAVRLRQTLTARLVAFQGDLDALRLTAPD